jgi:tRNA A37 threonylcarbamoyladenosine dehydratase
MRRECKKRGIKKLKVVYSTEEPRRPLEDPAVSCRDECICSPGTRKSTVRRDIPGSTAFVPSVAGLILAGEVIKDLSMKRSGEDENR